MESAIEIFATINFAIIGFSHIFQHRAWAEFFVLLSKQGRPGAFANGLVTLVTGSLIVAFHNVWTGIPVVLTIIGWGFVLKSALVFLSPECGLRSMAHVQPDNSRGALTSRGTSRRSSNSVNRSGESRRIRMDSVTSPPGYAKRS